MNRTYPTHPILIADDEKEIRLSVRTALALAGLGNVDECADGTAVRDRIDEGSYSAIVLDLSMPKVRELELLEEILSRLPGTPVIVATGEGNLETAVRCMRAGAFDYLAKPIDRTRLVTSVQHAIEKWETGRELDSLREGILSPGPAHLEAFREIITDDSSMHALFKYAEAISPTSLPILITGETGVGKELLARSIHRLSGRGGEFVPVNVAGLDDTLFSDTLFGHGRGAYTGADSAREGMVARAEGGTLFLDEIGDLATESQIKLLRLLQEREYSPLGSDRPRATSARFVFATNIDVTKATAENRFRKDLLFRLRSHQIKIPALRQRPGDIPLLLEHFFDRAAHELGKRRPTVPPELVPLLQSYHFPGNVRELEGMVFDAVVRHHSRVLSLTSFRDAIGDALGHESSPAAPSSAAENPFVDSIKLPTLKEATEQLIEEALRRSDGNQTTAARQLGITRSALNRRLNR